MSTTLASPQAPSVDPATRLALLTESVRSRISQARLAFVSTIISLLAFSTLLVPTVTLASIAVWYVPVLLVLCWRVWIAARASRCFPDPDATRLLSADRQLRANSIINQTLVGTGIWTVAPFGNDITPYFVTLVISLFGMGAAVSLVNDFRTVAVSLPILFGQCILYWLLQGWDGLHVSLPLATILVLVMTFARQTERIHADSIAIRFENDELLERLEAEKATALSAQHEAEQANRSKSRFLAAASHDLRQPLYAVTMLRDTLAMHELPEPASRIVDQQGVALDALSHMFDNLLQISRLESGSVEVRPQAVPVRETLDQLADEFRPECQNKGLSLEVQGDASYAWSDADLMGRLLRNLVSNAVRYTDQGRVTLSCRNVGEAVEVLVGDTGGGIPDPDQTRVFQEFVQLNNPQRDRTKGVGLGLSIVRHIANLLGLEVTLRSRENEGTTVVVRFPRAEAPVQATPPRSEPTGTWTPSGYVWIVEDDPLVRDAFASHLNTLGIRHDFGRSRADLEKLADCHGWPSYAVVDDMLGSDETGLDIAWWLSQHIPAGRILIATGNSDPERLDELSRSPFRTRRKPVSSAEMVRWMNQTG